jgi:hypothetical protein
MIRSFCWTHFFLERPEFFVLRVGMLSASNNSPLYHRIHPTWRERRGKNSGLLKDTALPLDQGDCGKQQTGYFKITSYRRYQLSQVLWFDIKKSRFYLYLRTLSEGIPNIIFHIQMFVVSFREPVSCYVGWVRYFISFTRPLQSPL